MPKRSTGCITCRKRKVRCDEGRPGCEKCAIHGVRCAGYGPDRKGRIEFKDQTIITAKRAEQHYEAKKMKKSSTQTTNGQLTLVAVANDTDRTSPSTASHDSNGSYQDQALVLWATSGPNSPVSIRSPNAERMQIYEEFIATYLPRGSCRAQDGHFSFYQSLASRSSDQQALEKGMDALSLVQLGSLYKDERLVKESIRQYGHALRYLGNSIARGDFLYDDDVLAAVTCLAGCELYEEIGKIGDGWIRHVQGANQLIAARGPKSFKSELALLLYANQRHAALLHALLARKAPFMAAPEWRRLAFMSPLTQDESTGFYDVAIQVPGLLERHDELDKSSSIAVIEIDDLLEDSRRLEQELREWHATWQAIATYSLGGRTDCELRPIEEFTTFFSLVADRSTFDQAYSFPDFLVAYLHSIYWQVMFQLRRNTQSLHKLRHSLDGDWFPRSEEVVPEDELLGYVLDLCRCFPFFVEPISSSAGHIGIFMPLRTAAFYFTEKGHWKWLKWIGEVRSNVFVKGLSPPGVENAKKEPRIIPSVQVSAS